MNTRLQHYVELAICLVVLALVWWHFTPKPAPVGTTIAAQPSPDLKGQPKQDITPPKVEVYTPPAKVKLGLPANVQSNSSMYVLGSAKLPADTQPHTITSVIDEDTGEVQTFDRRDPLPWLAAERSGYIQLGGGVKTGVGRIGRAAGAYELVRMKALQAGFDGTLDTDGQAYAGFRFRYDL
jgi:hypothetical protein